jgi:hypothetical protein
MWFKMISFGWTVQKEYAAPLVATAPGALEASTNRAHDPLVAACNLYIQAQRLMHSAPLPGPVKTRVFRDCRANQKGASGQSHGFRDAWFPASPNRSKNPFTEENTYQNPLLRA